MDMPRNALIIGWRKIDDVARGGDDVLLFSPDATEPQVFVGFWAEWEPLSDHSQTDPCWVDSWTHRDIDTEPTHWMPIPELPS